MPTSIEIVFAPEDEKQFFSFLAPYELECYPERVPPGYRPFRAKAENADQLVEPAYYLAAANLGVPIQVRPFKRGPNKGFLDIDEVNSPVFHYERSVFDENGELRSGHLWTFLDLSGDVFRNPAFPEAFRRMFVRIREHLVKQCHRSDPAGYLVGSHAARFWRQGGKLRVAGRTGDPLGVWK